MTFADSHCHPDDSAFEADRDAVIERALSAGVTRILAIGTGDGPPDLEPAIRLAECYPEIVAACGIHPQYAPNAKPSDYKQLAELMRHPKCVALGEIGLDYHWEPYDKDLQKAVFTEQMAIARDARKPISIHTRDAWDDTVALLREHWAPTGLPCVMHCFTGTPEQAKEVLDLGFYVSLSGVVTYPKATALHEAAKMVPLDRLLIETDAPYLAPVPFRGKRNEPSYVVHTASRVAELRGVDVSVIAGATAANLIRYTEGFE